MASLKPVIRAKQINVSGKTNIKIRVSHQGKTRYIATPWYIEPHFWDNANGMPKPNYPNAKHLIIQLNQLLIDYEKRLLDLGTKVELMHINAVVDYLKRSVYTVDFFEFAEELISQMLTEGRKRNAEIYQTTVRRVKTFLNASRLDLSQIDFKFLTDFERYLRLQGLKTNSISVYFRTIRAIYNRAIDYGYIGLDSYPFRRFKIKSENTEKRNLSIDQLRRLFFEPIPTEWTYYRDVFKLSFLLIGINIKDLYFLQEYKNGRIFYRRSKTKKLITIKVEPEAKELIQAYKGQKYLLRFADDYVNYRNFNKSVNKFLHRIAKYLEIDENLTTYYARHTWATIAANLGISKDIIGLALGHSTQVVTDIYIEYDHRLIDKANRKVINFVFEK